MLYLFSALSHSNVRKPNRDTSLTTIAPAQKTFPSTSFRNRPPRFHEWAANTKKAPRFVHIRPPLKTHCPLFGRDLEAAAVNGRMAGND